MISGVTDRSSCLSAQAVHEALADFDRICDIAVRGISPDQSASSLCLDDFVTLAALGLWAAEPDLIDPILLEAPIRVAPASAQQRLRSLFVATYKCKRKNNE